jgi:arylsulfatase A-like enzyme
VIDGTDDAQLDTAEISIGKLLKSAAAPTKYATANIGKWHLHTQTLVSRNYPAVMGYDHYSGNFSGALQDYFSWQKIVDGAAPVTVNNYATSEQTDDAIAWLETLDGSKPFFLWQAFNAPHSPFHLPPAALHSVPGLTGTDQHIQQNRKEYFRAMLEAMDSEIGRLFQWLDDHNLRDSTTIVFIGDNGDAANVCQFPNPQRAKGTVYEAGVHVPMIISGPSVVAPGRSSDALVSTVDLFATIVEMAGFSAWESQIPSAKPVDAVSLLPILKNENTTVRNWNFTEVFSAATMPDDAKAIRDLTFKLIRFDDGHKEFYKISSDPHETSDLLMQLPLSTEAQAHYLFLCSALTDLVGASACLPIVGTENLPDEAVSVFPNPSTGQISIKINDLQSPEFSRVQIFDARGTLVFEKENTAPTLEIGGLAPGVYFLKVGLEKGEMVKKLAVY